ncbi:hypothetical protein MUK42_01386 [Musa troglodytarum]|uniref:Uncharacterized protein n=1 Tax=Musa troglodytarum TaxID=320322 RepID=A0A9E7JTR1_9LILI|nr:hypothetical protein MUK42_01386 [Musa troglodytarum]
MKPGSLLSPLLLVLLFHACRSASNRTALGGADEARRLPRLYQSQPAPGLTTSHVISSPVAGGLNATVVSRAGKGELDAGRSTTHSKGGGSGAGKGGGKGVGSGKGEGGGSQSVRQPRDPRSSGASRLRPCSSLARLLLRLHLLCLLLWWWW